MGVDFVQIVQFHRTAECVCCTGVSTQVCGTCRPEKARLTGLSDMHRWPTQIPLKIGPFLQQLYFNVFGFLFPFSFCVVCVVVVERTEGRASMTSTPVSTAPTLKG